MSNHQGERYGVMVTVRLRGTIVMVFPRPSPPTMTDAATDVVEFTVAGFTASTSV